VSKPAQSFYSAAVGHREINGIYLATFAMPGDLPQWVTDESGKPKHFGSAMEAELAGFRVMATKLNKVRDVQACMTKRDRKRGIKAYHAPKQTREPTVEQVFGKSDECRSCEIRCPRYDQDRNRGHHPRHATQIGNGGTTRLPGWVVEGRWPAS
jgi:hypothetical protein